MLGILWMDLLYDLHAVRKRGGGGDRSGPIAAHYGHVLRQAAPLGSLIGVVMVATLGVSIAQVVDDRGWNTGLSAAFVLLAIVIARGRTIPAALRLGVEEDRAEQARLARSVRIDHLACSALMVGVLVIQLGVRGG